MGCTFAIFLSELIKSGLENFLHLQLKSTKISPMFLAEGFTSFEGVMVLFAAILNKAISDSHP